MKKITSILCLMFVFIMVFALPASASSPYQTYTYSINGKALHSPDAYTPSLSVDSTYMGLFDSERMSQIYPGLSSEDLSKKMVAINAPADLETDSEQNVYIADTENDRIIVLDRYYKVKTIIDEFVNEQGIKDSLAGPQGVFVTPDKYIDGELVEGRIFVCDTDVGRIVTFTHEGEFLKVIPQPESQLFSENSVYKPVAVAVDRFDRMYVVSSTTYQGIIVMTDEGEFTGFIGAQAASVSAWQILWRRFQTEEQRKRSEQILSTEFNNITINDEGFIYVTTSSIDEASVSSSISGKSKSGDFAPVKMLNAAGDEIMRRNGFYPPSGEVDMAKASVTDSVTGPSTVVDAAVGPEKTWSIIDQKRSKVFTYDFDGNLLFAFGDTGTQLGNIPKDSLRAVTYQGDNMLLLDKSNKLFTVFKRTQYGDILVDALRNQNERRYDQSIGDWREILKRNSNFDTAYIGIGNAMYRSGDYEEAIEYYQAAYDTENYSAAYKEIRKNWMSKPLNLLLIPVIVVVVILAWSKFMKLAKKVNKRAATSGTKRTYAEELLYVFHLILHPFDGFWDLKHEKRGSMRAALTILGVTIVATYYQSIGQGYVLNPQRTYATIFSTIISVLVPFALWVIANWCLTTLFEGEGSMKDIFIATCYSLAPLALLTVPATIASNFVIADEADLISLITVFGFIWTGILIFFGSMVTHDYSLGKNLLMTLATIVGMAFIIFIVILFSTLLGNLVSFVTNIVTEIQYRV